MRVAFDQRTLEISEVVVLVGLAVKFLIALMGLIAAIIGYQTQLLGLGGGAPSQEPDPGVEFIDPDYNDDDCVYAGGYDACSGSR